MDYSGSYMRFGPGHSFPSNRPPNNNLSRVVVSKGELTNHERNVKSQGEARPPNKYADTNYKSTDYGKDMNMNLEGQGFFDDLRPSRLKRTFGQVMSDIKPLTDVATNLLM